MRADCRIGKVPRSRTKHMIYGVRVLCVFRTQETPINNNARLARGMMMASCETLGDLLCIALEKKGIISLVEYVLRIY